MNLSARVVDVDCEKGILTFADGAKIQKDVIIGADGVHVRGPLKFSLLQKYLKS